MGCGRNVGIDHFLGNVPLDAAQNEVNANYLEMGNCIDSSPRYDAGGWKEELRFSLCLAFCQSSIDLRVPQLLYLRLEAFLGAYEARESSDRRVAP